MCFFYCGDMCFHMKVCLGYQICSFVFVFEEELYIFISFFPSLLLRGVLSEVSSDVIESDMTYPFSVFRQQSCLIYVCVFLQAVGGHRRWAQWHPVRLCSFRSARLAGVNFHTSDGADVETVGREATISQHRARGASWDICGKVREQPYRQPTWNRWKPLRNW